MPLRAVTKVETGRYISRKAVMQHAVTVVGRFPLVGS
jgi:hypothetical protein